MSDYSRYLVLRYPITKDDAEMLEDKLMESPFGKHRKGGYFEVTGATDSNYDYKYFLDFIIKHTYGDECGDFGKIRTLKESEVAEFAELFKMLIPDIDMTKVKVIMVIIIKRENPMTKVKVVDYCWYNCCEPPAYYDEIDDEFYHPLTLSEELKGDIKQ